MTHNYKDETTFSSAESEKTREKIKQVQFNQAVRVSPKTALQRCA